MAFKRKKDMRNKTITWMNIINNTEKVSSKRFPALYNFDANLLNSTKLSKKEFSTIMETMCNLDGMDIHYVKKFVHEYEIACGDRTIAEDGHTVIKYNSISLDIQGYIDMLINMFKELLKKEITNKNYINYILRGNTYLSTEEKAVKVIERILSEIKNNAAFDTSLMIIDSRDMKLLVKYGIKDKRLLMTELLDAVQIL